MKTPEHERLLHDVLATADYTAFRAELAQQLRQQLRSRNDPTVAGLPSATPRFQWDARYLALAASLLFLGVVLWFGYRPTSGDVTQLVRSQPLNGIHMVRTSDQPVIHVRTRAFEARVETASAAQPLNVITDDELLAMFPGKAVALVSDTTGYRHLIFLDPSGPQIIHPGAEENSTVH